jgi:hypothetical protein
MNNAQAADWAPHFAYELGRYYAVLADAEALSDHTSDAAADMAVVRERNPATTVANFNAPSPSTHPEFLAQRARLHADEGRRNAGMPPRRCLTTSTPDDSHVREVVLLAETPGRESSRWSRSGSGRQRQYEVAPVSCRSKCAASPAMVGYRRGAPTQRFGQELPFAKGCFRAFWLRSADVAERQRK